MCAKSRIQHRLGLLLLFLMPQVCFCFAIDFVDIYRYWTLEFEHVADVLTYAGTIDGGQLGVFVWGTDSEKDRSVQEV